MSFDGPTVALIVATVVGPVAAVQAQKWVEKFRETRQEKLRVFAALMYTRGTRLSLEHVQALNRIELAFHQDPRVMSAWRGYIDNLNQAVSADTQAYVWGERERLFIDLLFEMSHLLGYPFSRTDIKNGTYRPAVQGSLETAHLKAMALIEKIADGHGALPVKTIVSEETASQQTALLKLLVDMANGTAAWPIRDVSKNSSDSFK